MSTALFGRRKGPSGASSVRGTLRGVVVVACETCPALSAAVAGGLSAALGPVERFPVCVCPSLRTILQHSAVKNTHGDSSHPLITPPSPSVSCSLSILILISTTRLALRWRKCHSRALVSTHFFCRFSWFLSAFALVTQVPFFCNALIEKNSRCKNIAGLPAAATTISVLKRRCRCGDRLYATAEPLEQTTLEVEFSVILPPAGIRHVIFFYRMHRGLISMRAANKRPCLPSF